MTWPDELFARDRNLGEQAYSGDGIGVVNPGLFAIGDPLARGEDIDLDAFRGARRSVLAHSAIGRRRPTNGAPVEARRSMIVARRVGCALLVMWVALVVARVASARGCNRP